MLETLNSLDIKFFYWINSHYCTPCDYIFWTLSQGWSWAIVLVAVIVLITLRKEPKKVLFVLLGIALCFLLGDRISVMGFKEVVMRLRPCHALPDVRLFDGHCGGQYGFVSSHASNCFALASFLAFRYCRKVKALPYILLIWAALVAYSRPYLGVHYPGDIICGALVGLGCGSLAYFVVEWLETRYMSYKTKHNNKTV